jgi:YhcH/YjgK/YiaL family protein
MIVTDLEHIEQQVLKTPALKKALDFLRRLDVDGLTDGKVEIDGEDVFAMVQSYETVTMAIPKFEYHKKYIDLQYIVSGAEIIGWAPVGQMTITETYDTDRDVCFGTVPKGQITAVYLQTGQLAVLFPEDAHAPKLAVNAPSSVIKIVIKVQVSF